MSPVYTVKGPRGVRSWMLASSAPRQHLRFCDGRQRLWFACVFDHCESYLFIATHTCTSFFRGPTTTETSLGEHLDMGGGPSGVDRSSNPGQPARDDKICCHNVAPPERGLMFVDAPSITRQRYHLVGPLVGQEREDAEQGSSRGSGWSAFHVSSKSGR